MLRQLTNGVRRHPWTFGLTFLLSFAAVWGILEAFVAAYPQYNGVGLWLIIGAISLIASLFQAWSPNNITIHWNDLKLLVEIKTGDLFTMGGNVAISADDFFLTQHSKLIGKNSLMGQLVSKVYNGRLDLLEKDLVKFAPDPNSASTEDVAISGKNKRYPIGTTVAILGRQGRVFVTALCTIDTTNQVGRASASDVWVALQGLWRKVADNATGKPTSVPLFGTGQTSAGLSYSTALNLMLASLVVAARQVPIADKICIILPVSALQHIDLSVIRDTWSNPKR